MLVCQYASQPISIFDIKFNSYISRFILDYYFVCLSLNLLMNYFYISVNLINFSRFLTISIINLS